MAVLYAASFPSPDPLYSFAISNIFPAIDTEISVKNGVVFR